MCHYQTLFHDDHTGYVVRCCECEKIQVGYTNLVITFSLSDFKEFRWWLKKIKDDYHSSPDDRVRCVVIPTPCEGMKILVSARELRDFHAMLESADTELQSLELIKLFEIKS